MSSNKCMHAYLHNPYPSTLFFKLSHMRQKSRKKLQTFQRKLTNLQHLVELCNKSTPTLFMKIKYQIKSIAYQDEESENGGKEGEWIQKSHRVELLKTREDSEIHIITLDHTQRILGISNYKFNMEKNFYPFCQPLRRKSAKPKM